MTHCTKTFGAAASVLLLILAASCGYRFAGGQALPDNCVRVYVEMFDNKSSERGVESLFTRSLIKEIVSSTNAVIVGRDKAEAVIAGAIRTISIDTLTRSYDSRAVERRVSAVVDVIMSSAKGAVIWEVRGFSESEEYTVSQVHATDEAAERQGIEKISQRIAERVVSSMTDAF